VLDKMESQRKYEPSHSVGSAVAAREGGFQYCVNTKLIGRSGNLWS